MMLIFTKSFTSIGNTVSSVREIGKNYKLV